MLNNTVKIGLGFGLAWCIIKYVFFIFDPLADIKPMVMINILFLLMSISFGLYIIKRKREESNLILDIKNGLKAGFPYTIIVGVFMYFYYSEINPQYLESLVSDRVYEMEEKLNDPAYLAEFKEQNPKYEVKTKEEIFEEMRQSPENILSAGFTSTISILALLLLAVFYSIFVSIVYRRIVFKE